MYVTFSIIIYAVMLEVCAHLLWTKKKKFFYKKFTNKNILFYNRNICIKGWLSILFKIENTSFPPFIYSNYFIQPWRTFPGRCNHNWLVGVWISDSPDWHHHFFIEDVDAIIAISFYFIIIHSFIYLFIFLHQTHHYYTDGRAVRERPGHMDLFLLPFE